MPIFQVFLPSLSNGGPCVQATFTFSGYIISTTMNSLKCERWILNVKLCVAMVLFVFFKHF